MSTAAIDRYVPRTLTGVGPAVALAGITTYLSLRLLPDLNGKPLHEDEAVAGLIAAQSLGEVLQTVVLDRGGAPLHFVLVHFALGVDSSPETLRWLSVVFAIATIPLCYDIARRLAGSFAGLIAATLAATSQLLTIYGTFGRMYSLFAFASALAVGVFLRALERPGRGTALAAAAAALLPLAVHPFGVFLFGAEVLVAGWLWRGRRIRPALPAIAVGACALPLALTNLRLWDRYLPEAEGFTAGEAALHALGGAAGGHGPLLAAFVVAAGAGALALGRRLPAAAAFAVLTLAVPPSALHLAGISDRLSPRHFMFMLPVWIALVATGLSWLTGTRIRLAAFTAVAIAAALAPSAVSDPRTVPTGKERAVAAPAAWLRDRLSPGDVLYAYSPVFLASFPEAAQAIGYPREPVALARVAQRTRNVPAVFVALPVRDSWLILEGRGPFRDGPGVLRAAVQLLRHAPRKPYSSSSR
jgi:mannosyltransferase